MSQQTVSISVYNRWNNASLNSSISNLYPAGQSPGRKSDTTGAPTTDTLPRAEYMITIGDPIKSRGSRQYQAIVMFEVWGTTKELVDGYLESIYDAYVNCDEAATNPMTITNGTVQEVDDGSQITEKVDDAVFQGTQIINVKFSIPQQVPA